MGRRSDDFIASLTATDTGKVYFQPPSNVRLEYPCWIIERTTAYQPKANNKTYLFRPGYKCTHINRTEPDPDIIHKLGRLYERVQYQNHYVADNLHHDVFLIYY